MNYYKVYTQKDGRSPEFHHKIYADSLEEAQQQFTEGIRNYLSEKDNVIYISSIEKLRKEMIDELKGVDPLCYNEMCKEKEDWINDIDWQGSGYYNGYGEKLVCDDELLIRFKEDVTTDFILDIMLNDDEVLEEETEEGLK